MRAEGEELVIDRDAVLLCALEDAAVRSDRVLESSARERRAAGTDKVEILSDSLSRQEEPLGGRTLTLDGVHAAPDRSIRRPLIRQASKLEPRVPRPIRVAAVHQQVPFDALRWIAVRFEPLGAGLRVEEEGELQGEDTGFPAAVVPAEEQPAIFVLEHLLVIE